MLISATARKANGWKSPISQGDVIRLRMYNIRTRYPGMLDVAFDDDARNFTIQRPEVVTVTGSLPPCHEIPSGGPSRG